MFGKKNEHVDLFIRKVANQIWVVWVQVQLKMMRCRSDWREQKQSESMRVDAYGHFESDASECVCVCVRLPVSDIHLCETYPFEYRNNRKERWISAP